MYDITVEEIFDILEEFAGVEDDVVLDESQADTPFRDLGYDSLAVLELQGQLERRLGVDLPAGAAQDMVSANATRDLVRGLAPAAVRA